MLKNYFNTFNLITGYVNLHAQSFSLVSHRNSHNVKGLLLQLNVIFFKFANLPSRYCT